MTLSKFSNDSSERPNDAVSGKLSWSATYGEKHKLQRITAFTAGITPPEKVRLYWRHDHYVLQWWDPGQKKTLSDRVNGDLIAAIIRVREIEQRLENRGASPTGRRRLSFDEMLDSYLLDLNKRADAGEVDIKTVRRYNNALAYLRRFAEQGEIRSRYTHPSRVDRDFVLQFQAFLKTQRVGRNGREASPKTPLKSIGYIVETAHAAFTWASDPERGALLDSSFRNPFRGLIGKSRSAAPDQSAPPPITIEMAAEWLQHCDAYQVRLFAPLILFGLRAAELAWVLVEDVDADWFHVRCHEELDHLTKGMRDKKFPVSDLVGLIDWGQQPGTSVWLPRRDFKQSPGTPLGQSQLQEEYVRRIAQLRASTALARRQIRDRILNAAGAMDYDRIQQEFQQLATHLQWPREATLKGFRHLFATALENCGCPESYRRFFLGHSPGKAAIVRYTHLDQLRRHYRQLLESEYAPIVTALKAAVDRGTEQARTTELVAGHQ